MRTTTVYAIRHGETEWNVLGKQQGHLDSPLTQRGKKQAKRLAQGLTNLAIDTIFSSDLGRAQHTANIISDELNLPIALDNQLRERNLGILQGLTISEFKAKYPEAHKKFKSSDPDYCIPDGESERERYLRTISATENIIAKHSGKTILLVCHSGVVRSYFHRATGLPLETPRRFSLVNGAINQFRFAEDWTLVTWGDVSHLRNVTAMDDY
ncbi:MAG: histidine phosphatase family protein [Verrucomicrobiota bacterium]